MADDAFEPRRQSRAPIADLFDDPAAEDEDEEE
jgi:hypothetical protein